MKNLYLWLFLVVCFLNFVCCGKNLQKEQVQIVEDPLVAEYNSNLPVIDPVLKLSLDGLVGKWLLLVSEGEVDPICSLKKMALNAMES